MKEKLREEIWRKMEKSGISTFPPPRGRIPNFKGAEKTPRMLSTVEEYRKSEFIFFNPDSPQRPLRERALLDGKKIVMASPKLKEGFIFLKPIRGMERIQSTIRGAIKLGKPIEISELPEVDVFFRGCVAVTRNGDALGKGGGYSDLEYAILFEAGKIDERTPVMTSVHPIQIVREIPVEDHDVPVDIIITPEEVIRTDKKRRPSIVEGALNGSGWNR